MKLSWTLLACTAALALCAPSACLGPAPGPWTEELFVAHEVVTGVARRQTVLTGHFLGGAVADLAVVDTVDGGRRLQLFAFSHGTWQPRLEAGLTPEVLFVDTAQINGRERLLLFQRGRVDWFDPASMTERALVEIPTGFRCENTLEIPRLDVTRDLDGDGRDDIVLPATDGFWISMQRSGGTFADAVQLGPPEPFLHATTLEDGNLYGETGITATTLPWYSSRVHTFDYDGDDRTDLVFWNEGHFDVHLQDESGAFASAPTRFTPEVLFDSDGVYSLAFAFGDASDLSLITGFRKTSRRTVLHSFRDMNADGVTDLLTYSIEGRSVLKQRSTLGVHWGERLPSGMAFASRPSAAVRPRGKTVIGYAPELLRDFDGDGLLDVGFMNVRTGFGGAARALIANSIAADLELYRSEGGRYADEPTARIPIRPDMKLFASRGPFFPAVVVGDVTGDGVCDVLAGQGWSELRVFIGRSAAGIFEDPPLRVSADLPNHEKNVWLADLDLDGAQDLLVYLPSEQGPNRLVVHLARQDRARGR